MPVEAGYRHELVRGSAAAKRDLITIMAIGDVE
jgi:hypothetical protein